MAYPGKDFMGAVGVGGIPGVVDLDLDAMDIMGLSPVKNSFKTHPD
jgi:hypothetical protein